MHSGKRIGLLAAALLGCASAHAQDSGVYAGLGFGRAKQMSPALSDGDTSYKAVAGYSFNRFFSAEASYLDAGTLRDTFEGVGIRATSTGIQAAVLARLPLEKGVSVYARLGYVWYDTTTRFSSGGVSVSESASASDPSYGFGCEFRLGEHFRLRGEYEYVDVPDVDFDLLSLVAVWQF